jgi:hypothetical protein
MKRWIAGLSTALVLGLAVTACGSGGTGPATISIATLRSAAANSQRADTQTFEFTADIDAKGQQLSMEGSGIVSSDGKTGRFTMTIPSVGDIEEILTPQGVYLDMGSVMGSKLPDGKRWLFMSADEIAGQAGAAAQSLQGDTGQTSTQALEYLQATTGDVEKVGEDTVNGAPATHYVTHVDYGKWSEEHMPDATAAERAKVAKLGVVRMDVWIDGQDRVVKLTFDLDAAGFGGDGARMKMTMEITDFGEPLDVQAPPADEVVTQSELAGSTKA